MGCQPNEPDPAAAGTAPSGLGDATPRHPIPVSTLWLANDRFCLNCFVPTIPRGVTVTQRPLEALFMVRIHAR
jgi:hypothetical protein